MHIPLAPAVFCDHEGLNYREVEGGNGLQLNLQDCPWCGDHRFKNYCDAEKGYGVCFHCGETYSLPKLIEKITGLDAFSIVRMVASQPAKKKKVFEKPPEPRVLSTPALEAISGAGNYLTDRGVSAATANHFGLRYCRSGYHEVQKDTEIITQDFSNRVIIPIHDVHGKLMSFQGRDITGIAKKKYLFPLAKANVSTTLYSSHRVVGQKHVLLCEGVFDVIACHPLPAIASFGKSLSIRNGSPDQMDVLSQLRQSGMQILTFCWDGTKDACDAALKKALHLSQNGYKVQLTLLPKGCDPNEVKRSVLEKCIGDASIVDTLTAPALQQKINQRYA